MYAYLRCGPLWVAHVEWKFEITNPGGMRSNSWTFLFICYTLTCTAILHRKNRIKQRSEWSTLGDGGLIIREPYLYIYLFFCWCMGKLYMEPEWGGNARRVIQGDVTCGPMATCGILSGTPGHRGKPIENKKPERLFKKDRILEYKFILTFCMSICIVAYLMLQLRVTYIIKMRNRAAMTCLGYSITPWRTFVLESWRRTIVLLSACWNIYYYLPVYVADQHSYLPAPSLFVGNLCKMEIVVD